MSFADLLAVDIKSYLAALAQTATGISEFHAHLMGAGRQRVGGLGVEVLDTTQVVAVLELAVVGIQAPAADAGALRDDHALSTGLRHLDLSGHRVRFVLEVEHTVLRQPAHVRKQHLGVALMSTGLPARSGLMRLAVSSSSGSTL